MSANPNLPKRPRSEWAADALELNAQGMNGVQVAERLGISRSFAYSLLSDPDGTRERERKRRYYGECVDCGAPTSYGVEYERCAGCAPKHLRRLTRRWVIDSINEWFDMFGAPPTATDWNQSYTRVHGPAWRVARYQATGRVWPSVSTARDHFGSWNAAIEAAGFDPTPPGRYGREGEDPDAVAETVRLYRSGLTCAQVAERMGISAGGVWCRLVAAGEPRRPRWSRAEAVAA